MKAGRSNKELHHFPNRYDPLFTVDIPGNDHRILSHHYRLHWPMKTYRNPHGSPLLKASASIRGWLDILRIILERGVGWIPEYLEDLDSWLEERLGPGWWRHMRNR